MRQLVERQVEQNPSPADPFLTIAILHMRNPCRIFYQKLSGFMLPQQFTYSTDIICATLFLLSSFSIQSCHYFRGLLPSRFPDHAPNYERLFIGIVKTHRKETSCLRSGQRNFFLGESLPDGELG